MSDANQGSSGATGSLGTGASPLREGRAESTNGYRRYGEPDLRRAERIRDFIATGFSTREVRKMAACLTDEGAGPCEAGLVQLHEKLESIDRLRAELAQRRETVLERIATIRASLHGDAPSAS